MVYIIELYIHSGIRYVGTPQAIGGIVCIYQGPYGEMTIQRTSLEHPTNAEPDTKRPTPQRADLLSNITALQTALSKYQILNPRKPNLAVTINTNSRYVIDCMTTRKNQWITNAYRTQSGRPLHEEDLLRQAYSLQVRLETKGSVVYSWVSKEVNENAIDATMGVLNDMDRGSRNEVHEKDANAGSSALMDMDMDVEGLNLENSGGAVPQKSSLVVSGLTENGLEDGDLLLWFEPV